MCYAFLKYLFLFQNLIWGLKECKKYEKRFGEINR